MRAYRFAVDVFVVVWVIAMLALGALAMRAIDRVASAADSFSEIATEETSLAVALAPLESFPVAGARIADADAQLRDAAARTRANAQATGDSIHELARITFGVVALLALFPVVAFYLPMRVPRSVLARSFEHGRPAAT